MILAEKIMTLRKKNGWSQEELAEQLNISRQSVSKWESGASIPDLERIIAMSKLFDVSTDYLLKDEVEDEASSVSVDVYQAPDSRMVSVEEANDFMNLTAKTAVKMAIATTMCVFSPIPVILLAGLTEYGKLGISENMVGGFGVTILLVLIAIAVAVFILCGMRLEKYEYMEKERLTLQYGVQGIVEKKKEDFSGKYQTCIVVGVTLCILGVVPMLVAAGVGASDLVLVYCTVALLALIAIAVFLFVWSCSIQGSFQKLLQEGDYTIEKKEMVKRTSFFAAAYWCVATAVFLIWGFSSEDWGTAGLMWPVAALIFAAIKVLVNEVMKTKKSE